MKKKQVLPIRGNPARASATAPVFEKFIRTPPSIQGGSGLSRQSPTGQFRSLTYDEIVRSLGSAAPASLLTPEGKKLYEEQTPMRERPYQNFNNSQAGKDYQADVANFNQARADFDAAHTLSNLQSTAARQREIANMSPDMQARLNRRLGRPAAPQPFPSVNRGEGEGGLQREFAKGGAVKSSRGDGCAQRGKTKGRMV